MTETYISNHVPCQEVFQVPNSPECQQLKAFGVVLYSLMMTLTLVSLHYPEI